MTSCAAGKSRSPFPPWLKKRLSASGTADDVRALLRDLRLSTVCQSARCPNLCECFARGTATFMILGEACTRDCGFCAVSHAAPAPPEADEPERIAQAAAVLKLRHVVVTCVTRDDLPDGGAEHFRRTIQALRAGCDCTVEVLTSDLQGDRDSIARVASARPDVYNHNVETVARLYPAARPAADYARSLALLEQVNADFPGVATKSGLMVGLGETHDEVLDVLRDLRKVGCGLVTIGQYLRPTPAHLAVERFVPPEEFAQYEQEARDMGFDGAAAGPFVRSSYNAAVMFDTAKTEKREDGRSG